MSSMMMTHTNSKQNLSQKETFVQRPRRVCPRKSYCEDETEDDESSTEEMKQWKPKGKRKESHSFVMLEKKQKQIAQTLRWLGENYELKEGMCLPRCVMYTHYLDFCRKGKLSPSGPATFGKIIRQRFPKLTTRRLGTRGQSKYHYYGIVVKETSAYFHAGYSKKGLTRFSGMKGKGDVNTNHKKFSLSSKSGTLLPEFPNGKNVELPDEVSPHKVETFIMMYRTHCQRMLDTVISANFEGVQNFITHFWQGMPDHIISVLSCSAVVDIVAICDSILYKIIIDVLIPSTIQDLPESLREEITHFADSLLDWLEESLTEVPLALREAKFEVAKTFAQALKRQVCFVHLAQAARSALLSYEDVSRMLNDLSKIDFSEILSKSFFISENKGIFIKTKTYVRELGNLLSKQAPLEAYIEWLDSVVDRCLLKESEDKEDSSFEERCRKFLAMWSFITSRVLADLTLRSAPSFGVFHLIHTAFEEYVFLVVENQKMVEMDQKLKSSLQRRLKKAENQMAIQPIESELEGPKENRQPQNNPIELKEVPRAKRRKTTTVVWPRSKLRNANDQINQQSARNVQRCSSPEEGQCTVVSASQVVPAEQQIYQTPQITNPTRPFLEPTSMSVSTNLTSFTPMQNRPTFQQCHLTDLEQQRDVDNIPEVNAFQGDFISAIDKAFFSSNVTLSTNEYMGATWIQNEPSNLTVLNPVNFQDSNPVTNAAMNFPRGGNYQMNYNNSVALNQSYTNTHSIPTNPRPQEISYISPTKDDFGYVPSITNIYSRLNTPTTFYDHMRNAVQVGAADVTGFSGLLNAPVSSVGMDGLSHDAQLNRLGIGAV